MFYCIRDNYVIDVDSKWMKKFRSIPEIAIILEMIDLVNSISIEKCLERWSQISKVQLIKRDRLIKEIQVPRAYLDPQCDSTETKNK